MYHDTNDSAADLLKLVVQRGPYLAALADGVTEKRALAAEHDASRSTIDRAIRELDEAGLVDRGHGSVALTLRGRLALATYEDFRERLVGLEAASNVLETIPDDAFIHSDFLADANVVDATLHTPQRPIDAIEDVLADATHVQTLATSVLPDVLSVYRDRIVDGSLSADVVVTPDVLDVLVADYHGPMNDMLCAGRLELHLTDDVLPYGLVVASNDAGDVALLVCGETSIAGVVENKTPTAVEWARERFEAAKTAATRLA
mgnify:FL=1